MALLSTFGIVSIIGFPVLEGVLEELLVGAARVYGRTYLILAIPCVEP